MPINGNAFWCAYTSGPTGGERRLAVPFMISEVPDHERERVLALVLRRQPFLAADLAQDLNIDYGRGRRPTRAEQRTTRELEQLAKERPIRYGMDREDEAA